MKERTRLFISACSLVAMSILPLSATSANSDWNKVAEASSQALITHFWNNHEGYFNSKADQDDTIHNQYWPQAHAMDVVIDAYLRSGSVAYSRLFDQWYEGIKKKANGSYFNDYYDDEEWICLTMLRLYECTKTQKYLDTAQALWNDIKQAWNTNYGGGGMAWRKSQPWSKNACSNGPAGIIAAKLYKITHRDADLELAKKIYDWQRSHLYDPATGSVYDNLNCQNGKVNKHWTFTYNQGTFVGMCHELYTLTGQAVYLLDAVKASTFTITSLTDPMEKVLKDEGTGDGGLFKGIFVRYFSQLMQDPHVDAKDKERFMFFLTHNARTLQEKGTNAQGLYGSDWASTTGGTDLGTHVSGCMLMEAVALLTRQK